jgi:hypothetical protein
VSQSAVVPSPGWGSALLECPQGALMVAGDLGRQRIAWVGFDSLESNWPLRVSFPIFIANAVEWLNPANARNSQLLVRAGDPFQLALVNAVDSAQIRLPGGQTRDLDVDPAPPELNLGQYDKVEANVERQANTELWRTLALLGLAVLMFEWWWYHKRTA